MGKKGRATCLKRKALFSTLFFLTSFPGVSPGVVADEETSGRVLKAFTVNFANKMLTNFMVMNLFFGMNLS